MNESVNQWLNASDTIENDTTEVDGRVDEDGWSVGWMDGRMDSESTKEYEGNLFIMNGSKLVYPARLSSLRWLEIFFYLVFVLVKDSLIVSRQ